MVTFQQEMLFEVASEVDDLLQMHYQELTLNKERVKLNPMWTEYSRLEQAGVFKVFTARDEDKLVGYSAFFVRPHLHYADLLTAINDVLFLHPDYRQGLTGVRLLKHCESALKEMGVHKLCWHAKLETPLIPLLKRQGYTVEEVSLGKML